MIDPFGMGYTAIGGLGIFILGMKYLSDSLQAVTSPLGANILDLDAQALVLARIGSLAVVV